LINIDFEAGMNMDSFIIAIGMGAIIGIIIPGPHTPMDPVPI
jgi:hypothetical protein